MGNMATLANQYQQAGAQDPRAAFFQQNNQPPPSVANNARQMFQSMAESQNDMRNRGFLGQNETMGGVAAQSGTAADPLREITNRANNSPAARAEIFANNIRQANIMQANQAQQGMASGNFNNQLAAPGGQRPSTLGGASQPGQSLGQMGQQFQQASAGNLGAQQAQPSGQAASMLGKQYQLMQGAQQAQPFQQSPLGSTMPNSMASNLAEQAKTLRRSF
jgi:hypothetical protein